MALSGVHDRLTKSIHFCSLIHMLHKAATLLNAPHVGAPQSACPISCMQMHDLAQPRNPQVALPFAMLQQTLS